MAHIYFDKCGRVANVASEVKLQALKAFLVDHFKFITVEVDFQVESEVLITISISILCQDSLSICRMSLCE